MVTHEDWWFWLYFRQPPDSKAIVVAIISDLIHGYGSSSILGWMIGCFIVLTRDPLWTLTNWKCFSYVTNEKRLLPTHINIFFLYIFLCLCLLADTVLTKHFRALLLPILLVRLESHQVLWMTKDVGEALQNLCPALEQHHAHKGFISSACERTNNYYDGLPCPACIVVCVTS